MEEENIASTPNRKNPVFSRKEDVTVFIENLYRDFYRDKSQTDAFSERGFAKKTGVSQSVLNNLRNSHKKEIEAEIAIKILKGMEKSEYVEPVLSILAPESKEILYEELKKKHLKHSISAENDEIGRLSRLSSSKAYGHILSVVMTGMEREDTTVDHIKNISPDGEFLLGNLVKMGILEITQSRIVRPVEKIRDFFKDKKMYLDLPEIAEYTRMLLENVFNAPLVQENKEIGSLNTITGCFGRKKVLKIFSMLQEVMDYIYEPEEELPEEYLKMAWSLMGILLYDPKKYNKGDNGGIVQ